jgi:hypothetical protein
MALILLFVSDEGKKLFKIDYWCQSFKTFIVIADDVVKQASVFDCDKPVESSLIMANKLRTYLQIKINSCQRQTQCLLFALM